MSPPACWLSRQIGHKVSEDRVESFGLFQVRSVARIGDHLNRFAPERWKLEAREIVSVDKSVFLSMQDGKRHRQAGGYLDLVCVLAGRKALAEHRSRLTIGSEPGFHQGII